MAIDSLREALDRLATRPCCGYTVDSAPATEPTALAAMALLGQSRQRQAAEALIWLADLQQTDGSLGIDSANQAPCWPTGWAVLAWRAALAQRENEPAQKRRWAIAAQRAVEWIVSLQAHTQPRSPMFGHDTTLLAWPWIAETHSWVEPTAINLLAMKASGQADHPRSRQAVAMLLDRACSEGGWNFGNTIVLGNVVKPQVQPTGMALLALGGEPTAARQIERALGYLERSLSDRTTTVSLCYGLMGAAVHGRRFPSADAWLEAACRRTLRRDASPYRLALIVLAASERVFPWLNASLSAEKAKP